MVAKNSWICAKVYWLESKTENLVWIHRLQIWFVSGFAIGWLSKFSATHPFTKIFWVFPPLWYRKSIFFLPNLYYHSHTHNVQKNMGTLAVPLFTAHAYLYIPEFSTVVDYCEHSAFITYLVSALVSWLKQKQELDSGKTACSLAA